MRLVTRVKLILLIAASIVIVIGGYTLVERNHIGAPSDPYGPCPAGSHYTLFWYKPGTYNQGQGPGVISYLGWTGVASCSGSIQIGLSTQSHQAGQP